MEKNLIIINNNIYKNYDIEVKNNKYNTKNFYIGETNIGYSPCFKFNICDKIFIQIETMLLERKLENLSIGKNINIKKYITDILYKNESERETLTKDKYTIYIRKEKEDIFFLDFTLTEKNNKKYSVILNVYLKIRRD